MRMTVANYSNKHIENTLGSWMRGDALPSGIVCSFDVRLFVATPQQARRVWSGGKPT